MSHLELLDDAKSSYQMSTIADLTTVSVRLAAQALNLGNTHAAAQIAASLNELTAQLPTHNAHTTASNTSAPATVRATPTNLVQFPIKAVPVKPAAKPNLPVQSKAVPVTAATPDQAETHEVQLSAAGSTTIEPWTIEDNRLSRRRILAAPYFPLDYNKLSRVPQSERKFVTDLNADGVPLILVTFLNELLEKASWPVLPLKFIYDAYLCWLAKFLPEHEPFGRETFNDYVVKALVYWPEWTYRETAKTTRLPHCTEPLIDEWTITSWFAPGTDQHSPAQERLRCQLAKSLQAVVFEPVYRHNSKIPLNCTVHEFKKRYKKATGMTVREAHTESRAERSPETFGKTPNDLQEMAAAKLAKPRGKKAQKELAHTIVDGWYNPIYSDPTRDTRPRPHMSGSRKKVRALKKAVVR